MPDFLCSDAIFNFVPLGLRYVTPVKKSSKKPHLLLFVKSTEVTCVKKFYTFTVNIHDVSLKSNSKKKPQL